jgi:hypothetical protein
MKNLLVKCIENFLISIFLVFKILNDVIVVMFCSCEFISHLKN